MNRKLTQNWLFAAFFLCFLSKNEAQTYFTVKFPDDISLTTCNAAPPFTPPIITNEACNVGVGISYTDEIYTVVPDACKKIVRTWRLLYWCGYDPNWPFVSISNPSNTTVGPTVQGNLGNHGLLQYLQIIKIQDTGDPILAPCPDLTFCDFTPNDPTKYNHNGHDFCEGPIELTTKAYDLCSGSDLNFRYLLFLDLNNDGAFDSTMVSDAPNAFPILVTKNVDTAFAKINFPAGFEMAYGKHMVKWIARDGCGHEAVCGQFFTVKDCKNPTVVCLAGLSAPLMQPSGMLTIWASDFIKYAYDNCTPSNLLDFGIRRAGDGTGFTSVDSLNLTCDDLGTVPLEVWAKDAAGNADFCQTYIVVTASNPTVLCPNAPLKTAGKVEKTNGNGLFQAKMTVSGNLPTGSMVEETDASGAFKFPNLPPMGPYLLTPSTTENFKTGITNADAERLKNHLWGLDPLPSPLLRLAADVDGSGSLDWADFQLIRQMAMGLISTFPVAAARRFVCKDFVFPNPSDPFSVVFPETMTLSGVGEVTANFVSFKMGDLVETSDSIAPVNPTLATQNIENQAFSSLSAQPNPFNESTILTFELPSASEVELSIFDIFGKKWATEKRSLAAGENIWPLDASQLPAFSGLLFVQLKSARGEAVLKVMRSKF